MPLLAILASLSLLGWGIQITGKAMYNVMLFGVNQFFKLINKKL